MWRLATSARVILRGGSILHNTVAASTKAPAPLLVQMSLNNVKPLPRCRNFSSQDQDKPANYQCVHVFVSVKPGDEDAFLAASLANACASSLEPGIARFDVIQQEDDPTKFVLVEVYKNGDAPAAHKGTNHYLAWRKAVEHMMAEPRKAIKYKNMFPATVGGWDYGNGISLE
mmetsp:Transcript_10517/g.23312  ORF Transcript_10517/g.23312 Transcript_10517/m.23312 type:complete len:172 (-) Transcript_10517:264-779(-)